MKPQVSKRALAGVALFLPLVLCAWGCSPQTAGAGSSAAEASAGREGASSAIEATWSPDSDCATCHDTEASTSADGSCLAGHHTMTQGFTCITCHTDDGTLAEVHADMDSGKTPKKLKKTEVSENVCLSCHGKADLVQKTATSTVLTDDNGTAVNPHDLPQSDEHAAITCTSCHQGHNTDGVQQVAPAFCQSCHHANVYECGTCHE